MLLSIESPLSARATVSAKYTTVYETGIIQRQATDIWCGSFLKRFIYYLFIYYLFIYLLTKRYIHIAMYKESRTARHR